MHVRSPKGHADSGVGTSGRRHGAAERRFENLIREADAAGHKAAREVKPTPMHLVDHNGRHFTVPEGMCGFAEIRFAGNTAFGRWAKKTGRANKAYRKGLYIWVSEFGQSYERKKAYASAFAQVLCDNGVPAYSRATLD